MTPSHKTYPSSVPKVTKSISLTQKYKPLPVDFQLLEGRTWSTVGAHILFYHELLFCGVFFFAPASVSCCQSLLRSCSLQVVTGPFGQQAWMQDPLQSPGSPLCPPAPNSRAQNLCFYYYNFSPVSLPMYVLGATCFISLVCWPNILPMNKKPLLFTESFLPTNPIFRNTLETYFAYIQLALWELQKCEHTVEWVGPCLAPRTSLSSLHVDIICF